MSHTFLSCDWGTSSFRLRLIDVETLQTKAESRSGEGVSHVFERWEADGGKDRIVFYQSVLRRHMAQIETQINYSLNEVYIVVSGMASSTIGIKELPYKHLPFSASGSDLAYEVMAGTPQFRNPIILVSGASGKNDVMRGEETQLAGCAQLLQAGKGLFVFPGTHSKHIYVENGLAIHFETYMTGEVFQLFSQNSILSKSVSSGSDIEDGGNGAAFKTGVLEGMQQHLLHAAFMVRTNDLFQRFSKKENYWYLSGLVIGAELNGLLQKKVGNIVLVAQGSIAQSYQLAFQTLGTEISTVDVTEALIRAHAMILKQVVAK